MSGLFSSFFFTKKEEQLETKNTNLDWLNEEFDFKNNNDDYKEDDIKDNEKDKELLDLMTKQDGADKDGDDSDERSERYTKEPMNAEEREERDHQDFTLQRKLLANKLYNRYMVCAFTLFLIFVTENYYREIL